MNFRVGQKVVCVDCSSPALTAWDDVGRAALKARAIYTVTATTTQFTNGQSIQCAELPTESSRGGKRWYQSKRFRPLVEKKTDAGMAILKTILDEVNAGKHREIVDA